jgi:hypothetical protein
MRGPTLREERSRDSLTAMRADEDPTDAEALAGKELGRRGARLRRMIMLPHLLAGIGGGGVAYALLRALQLGVMGAHLPWVTGMASFFPCFAGAIALGRRAANAAVRLRMPGWRDELIAAHRLPPGSLDEYMGFL